MSIKWAPLLRIFLLAILFSFSEAWASYCVVAHPPGQRAKVWNISPENAFGAFSEYIQRNSDLIFWSNAVNPILHHFQVWAYDRKRIITYVPELPDYARLIARLEVLKSKGYQWDSAPGELLPLLALMDWERTDPSTRRIYYSHSGFTTIDHLVFHHKYRELLEIRGSIDQISEHILSQLLTQVALSDLRATLQAGTPVLRKVVSSLDECMEWELALRKELLGSFSGGSEDSVPFSIQ